MKRILTLLLILVLVPTISLAGSGIMVEQSTDTLSVNGTLSSQMMLKHNGANYVPLRFVSEALGAAVGYDKGNVYIETKKTPKVDIERLKESCVMVVVNKNGQKIMQGSGVLVGYDQILSCSHVTKTGNEYKIIYNNDSSSTGELIKSKYYPDMAILKPEMTTIKPVKIGDSDEVKEGDSVILIGSPLEKKNTVTEGIINGTVRNEGVDCFTSTAKANYGNSGGAAFSASGELIGLVQALENSDDDSIIIPINIIRKAIAN